MIGATPTYYLSPEVADVTLIERYKIAGTAPGKSGGFLALDWCDSTQIRGVNIDGQLQEADAVAIVTLKQEKHVPGQPIVFVPMTRDDPNGDILAGHSWCCRISSAQRVGYRELLAVLAMASM